MNDWPETARFLGTVNSLSSLSETDLERLRPHVRHRTVEKKEYVYYQGQGTEYLYFIRNGRVKVSQMSNGKEVILGFHGRGDLLGCCGLVGDVCYPCYAEAVERTDAVFIPREAFHRLLSQVPCVAAELLGQMVSRLREAHCKIKSLALEPVEERVVAVLLELGEKFGSKENGKVVLPSHVTRQQISEMAGTTIETTSRTISKLRRLGLVECCKRSTILGPDLLEQFAGKP